MKTRTLLIALCLLSTISCDVRKSVYKDLQTGMDYSEVHSRLAPNFILTGSQINNPVEYEIIIWDKKGNGSIKASTQLQIQ